MKNKIGWLFSTTSLATIVKTRPLSLALFESFGINPWKSTRSTIGEVCAASGIAWEAFADSLSKLEVPDRDSDWNNLPLTHLVDFLADEHQEFRHEFIPAIGRVLSEDLHSDSDSLLKLRLLVSEWPAFVSTLSDHIQEEEDVLFNRILRYDSTLRLGWVDPFFEGGSVQVFTAVRLYSHEHRDIKLMRSFLDRVQPVYPGQGEPCALEAALRPLLAGFDSRLKSHARLETEALIPRARAMEKMLYDQRIRGVREISGTGVGHGCPFPVRS